MDAFESFHVALAQSHETDVAARQLAIDATKQQQASERLAGTAVDMRREAVNQFARDLQNEDPLYRAALQIAWQDSAVSGHEEKIQSHLLQQLQLADAAAKELIRFDQYSKTQTTGVPFASVTYQQLEYISNPSSLSNPQERDLTRTKVTGLTALIGVLGVQPLTVGYTFERTGGSVNGSTRPLHIGLQYEAAVRIHSETSGWDYDVWEADPGVKDNQSGMLTIIEQKQRLPSVATISLEQGNENVYMVFSKGSELHIGKAALADFAVGLDAYRKPHDTAAFNLVSHIVLGRINDQ